QDGGGKEMSCGGNCHCNEHRLEVKDHSKVLLYEPRKTKIIKSQRLGSRHHLIRIEAHTDHEPGQFFQLTVLGFGEAPISIASHSKDYIDLVINPVGSVTKEAIRKKVGQHLLLRGPFGFGYPMHYFYNNNIILVGGGCGVAPLKGVMDYIAQYRTHYRKVDCFFGYRSPYDSIFTKDFKKWEKDKVFDFTYAYSQAPPKFTGKIGYINGYLEQSGLNPGHTIALICGPPPMMLSVVESLKKMGFNDDQIWVSHERHMKCATGMCGHCMIEGKYTCKDGPVFRWDWIKDAKG
ncbi:hypothetical protein GOV07_01080, partial [Candidatus Woesearchaeota archaeon]|nr:hypothetical protein [Candidatus Woesearchaeota archaeon]